MGFGAESQTLDAWMIDLEVAHKHKSGGPTRLANPQPAQA